MQFNLPQYPLHVRHKKQKRSLLSSGAPASEVFDIFRQRWVKLTPEENVRQNLLHFLAHTLDYPVGLFAVECGINVGGVQKRCDAIVHRPDGTPLVVIECKAPGISLSQHTFDQAAVYNTVLNAPYLLLSNGTVHHFCRVDTQNKQFIYYQNLPTYQSLL